MQSTLVSLGRNWPKIEWFSLASNENDDEMFVESITQETTVLKAPDFSKEPNASLPPLAKENLLKLYLQEQQKQQI